MVGGLAAVTLPPTIVANQIIVCYLTVRLSTATIPTPPTGWNAVALANPQGTGTDFVLWKNADGTEDGATLNIQTSGGVQGYINESFLIDGADTTSPIDQHSSVAATVAATTLTIPGVTTGGADRLLIALASLSVTTLNAGGVEIFTFNRGTKFFEDTAGSNRSAAGDYEAQAAAGASGNFVVTIPSSAGLGVLLAIAPAAGGPPPETLRPTGVSGLSNLTGAYTDIDQDPDGTITDAGLVGSDPSGSTGSFSDQYADAQVAASGLANQLTNPANAVGSSEATTSASTGAVQNTDYANFFQFAEAAIAAAIPSTASITGLTVRLRDALSTLARGEVGVRVDTANGTQKEAENVAKTGLTTALPAAGSGVHTYAMTTPPTRAELIAAAFGVRVRYRRTASQAATFTLDWLRLEATWSVPGSTVNTQADVAMDDPVGTLATGAATGEIRARIRKLGSGSDPQGRIEVRNAAGTLLGTAIADTTITDTTAAGQLVSGTFDQSIILSKTDVVLRFVGTGAAGGLAELVAVEWNAQVAAGVVQSAASAPRQNSRSGPTLKLAEVGASSPRVSSSAGGTLKLVAAAAQRPRISSVSAPTLKLSGAARAEVRVAARAVGGQALTTSPGVAHSAPRVSAVAGGKLALLGSARETPRPAAQSYGVLVLTAAAASTPRQASRNAPTLVLRGAAAESPRGYARSGPALKLAGSAAASLRPTLRAGALQTVAMRAYAMPRPRTYASTSLIVGLSGVAASSARPGARAVGFLAFAGRAAGAPKVAARAGANLALAGRAASAPKIPARAGAKLALQGAAASAARVPARTSGALTLRPTATSAPRARTHVAGSLQYRGQGYALPRPATGAELSLTPPAPPAPWREVAVRGREDRVIVPARGGRFPVTDGRRIPVVPP